MPLLPPEAPRKTRDETNERTGTDYLKFIPGVRTVIRILDTEAVAVWKHYFPQGNGGRGFGAVCPNVAGFAFECPSELSVSGLPKEAQERKDATSRKKYIVNVLDRTPYTTCPTCNVQTPGVAVAANPREKECFSCHASLKGADFAPLNKVKILEQGPKLFRDQFGPIEQAQAEQFDGVDITAYDISISAQGERRDRILSALPQPPKELEKDALIDKETGELQVPYDLNLLAEPASIEEITLIMQGATIEQINAVKNAA